MKIVNHLLVIGIIFGLGFDAGLIVHRKLLERLNARPVHRYTEHLDQQAGIQPALSINQLTVHPNL